MQGLDPNGSKHRQHVIFTFVSDEGGVQLATTTVRRFTRGELVILQHNNDITSPESVASCADFVQHVCASSLTYSIAAHGVKAIFAREVAEEIVRRTRRQPEFVALVNPRCVKEHRLVDALVSNILHPNSCDNFWCAGWIPPSARSTYITRQV